MVQKTLPFEHRATLSVASRTAVDGFCEAAEKNGFSVSKSVEMVTIQAPLGKVRFGMRADGADISFSSENPAKLQLLKDLYAQRFTKLGLEDALSWDAVEQTAPLNQTVAELVAIEQISPNFMRIRLSGDFSAYLPPEAGLHFRLLFGPEGLGWPTLDERGLTFWPGGISVWHRPPYTVRAIDPQGTWIEVDIVLHSGGRVTEWCRAASIGAEIALHGPNGGRQPASHWLGLLGDETALPVIARMIEAAPAGTQGEAVIMVRDPADAQKIVTASDIALRWTKMDPARDPADILTALRLPAEDRYIFFAAEKAQATRAREVFKAMGLAKGEAKAASYWSLPREG